jgi:predicted nucleotidyltransferase
VNKISNNQFSEPINKMIQEVKEVLDKLYQKQLSDVILFGSNVSGSYKEESDIDLLAILEKIEDIKSDKQKYLPLISELSLKYDKVFSIVLFSKEDFQNKKTPLLLNIRQEGILL